MSEEGQRPGCFKFGCGGCLTLLALLLALLVIGGVLQAVGNRADRTVEEIDRQVDLPLDGEQLAFATRSRESGTVALPLSESAESVLSQGVGEVRLDVSLTRLRIEPGPPGSQIRLEGDFEAARFELSETVQERDDGSWSYRLDFGPKRGFLGILMGAGNNPSNDLTLYIPRGVPLDLVGNIGIGESELELGGLFLRNVRLDVATGDHGVSFSEPLQHAMEDFRLDGATGVLKVGSLGNASPLTAKIDHSVGDVLVDLTGSWTGDASILVDSAVGQIRVTVPEGVHVDLDRAGSTIGDSRIALPEAEVPADAPRLGLRAESAVGEVRVTGPR